MESEWTAISDYESHSITETHNSTAWVARCHWVHCNSISSPFFSLKWENDPNESHHVNKANESHHVLLRTKLSN